MQSLLVLGRQPSLGLAELESLYGADKLRRVGEKAAVVDVDPCLLAFERLGGSVKFCKVLTTLDTADWPAIEKFLFEVSPGHSQRLPAGKMRLGLSVIGLDVGLKQLGQTGLNLKRVIKKTGRNVRLIPNKSLELTSAQLLHNNLTGPTGWDLIFIKDGEQTIIAQTVKVQDIEAYAKRDRGRPRRDPKVGMLPPKLAQIIINLAVGAVPEYAKQSVCEVPAGEPIPRPPSIIGTNLLDPFCGTGVLLQEALLMDADVVGSDIDPRMVRYTEENLAWLRRQYDVEHGGGYRMQYKLEVADATTHIWKIPFEVVASEVYLGRPFTALPDGETLNQNISDCNVMLKAFLHNMHGQIKPGTRLCLAVPAWQTQPGRFKRLPLIDQISDLGYNRVNFEHARREDLI
jgi:hypothetical protein